MNARDELRDIILDFDVSHITEAEVIAEAILAAGYRKPRTITTAEELEALPEGSVVRDFMDDVAEKRGGVWCGYETEPMNNRRLAKYLPGTVLHEPEATK